MLLYLVALGDANGVIQVYDSSSFLLVNSFQAHTGQINRIKQLSYGYVATCSLDNTTKIWNVTTTNNNMSWDLIRTYTHTSYVWAIEYIRSDTMASSAYYDKSIQIWSISTGKTLITINTGNYVDSLKLLSNGFYLAAGFSDGQINIYNININGSLVSTLSGHKIGVVDFTLINSNLLASSSQDKTVRIWNLTTNTNKFIFNGHTDQVYGLKLVSSDTLASGSFDFTVKLWNTTSETLIRTLSSHTNWILLSVDMLISNQILVSGSNDTTIKTWNISTGKVLNTINTGLNIWTLAVLNLPI